MKIHYEPYQGYNEKYDFGSQGVSLNMSHPEPSNPKLLKEIGVGYIVEEITKRTSFYYNFRELSLLKQLLPEQIRVLLSHAYRIYDYHWCSSKSQFIRIFRNEVEQIAEQEIEPGMF
ncbi:MAG: hypothetical protein ACXACY_19060 [Candidatus Hodarchaeales archaeon]|jgi:hypothetical protein